ncbi:MAG: PAS domain S-box protein, partial [Ignavibacteria bacterium]|nr:PAS domain S-box protein [Ignavibacteria bacterium]
MTKRTSQTTPFQTFEEFVLFVPPGRTAMVVVPREEVLHQIYPLLLDSLPASRKFLLVSGQDLTGRGWPGRSFQPEAISKKGNALSKLVRTISDLPSSSRLVIDLPTFWQGRRRLLAEFMQSTGRVASRRQIALLWIVSPGLEGPDLVRIKPDFIADISPLSGSQELAFHLYFTSEPCHPSLTEVRIIQNHENRISLVGVMGKADGRQRGDVAFTLYEDLFLHSKDGILLFEPSGSLRIVNEAGAKILGLRGREPEDSELVKLIPAHSAIPLLRFLASLRMKRATTAGFRIQKPNNRFVELDVTAFPVQEGIWCARFEDITSERREGNDARKGFELFKSFFENSPVPEAVYSERKLLHQNSSFALVEQHFAGKGRPAALSRLLGRENKLVYREILALHEGNQETFDLGLTNEEGKKRSYHLLVRGVRVDGKRAFHCSFIDTTLEQNQAVVLQQRYDELRSVMEHTPQPLLTVTGTTIRHVNPSLLHLLGYPAAADLSGRKIQSIIGSKGRTRFLRTLSSSAGEGKPAATECLIMRADGATFDARASLSPGLMAGEPVVLISITDRTDEKKREEEVRTEIAVREFLLDLDTAFSSSMEIGEMLQEGLRVWKRALHCESGGIFLVSDEELSLAASSDLPERLSSILTADDQHAGLLGLILKTAEPLSLRIDQYPPHVPYRSTFEDEGIAQAFCVPLLSGEVIVGLVVLVSSRQVNPVIATDASLRAASSRCGRLMANSLRHKAVVSLEERFRHT